MSVYSKAELYELWTFFAGQHDEVQMMMDFALCNREEAQALIAEFEIVYEAHALDGEQRGKAGRQRRQI